MMGREANIKEWEHLFFIPFIFLLFWGCGQRGEGGGKSNTTKILDTLIFSMDKEGISSRGIQDSYKLGAYTFKVSRGRAIRQVSYDDIKDKIIPSDSFLKKWSKENSEGVHFEYYLFMEQEGLKGKLIPLDSNWHGSMLIKLDSIIE